MSKSRAEERPLATTFPCPQFWPKSLMLLSAVEKVTTPRKIAHVVPGDEAQESI